MADMEVAGWSGNESYHADEMAACGERSGVSDDRIAMPISSSEPRGDGREVLMYFRPSSESIDVRIGMVSFAYTNEEILALGGAGGFMKGAGLIRQAAFTEDVSRPGVNKPLSRELHPELYGNQ